MCSSESGLSFRKNVSFKNKKVPVKLTEKECPEVIVNLGRKGCSSPVVPKGLPESTEIYNSTQIALEFSKNSGQLLGSDQSEIPPDDKSRKHLPSLGVDSIIKSEFSSRTRIIKKR